MMDTIRDTLMPYYPYFKFVHLLAVMAWGWSTSHAFMFYLVPIFQEWRKNPGDPDRVKMRSWAMERFDEGVIIEHIAFPVILITAALMFFGGPWSLATGWVLVKLCVVAAIMIPLEICDYYLSHFGGNKFGIRMKGRGDRYEKMVQVHWLFLLVSTPVVIVFVTANIFMATVKPF